MRPTTLLAAFVWLIGTLLPAAEGKRLAFVVGVDLMVFAKTREELRDISHLGRGGRLASSSAGLTMFAARADGILYSEPCRHGFSVHTLRSGSGKDEGAGREAGGGDDETQDAAGCADGDIETDGADRTRDSRPGAFPARSGMEGSRAGEVRNFGGLEMVWCPPGEFWMGSPEDEAGRFDNETLHQVTLSRGFWLALTECTQGQWESMTGKKPSKFKGVDLPAETVSWEEVQGWLAKMNEKNPLPAGWKWELPTEAQWEYACRAGTDTAFAGRGVLDEMGWYGGNIRIKTDRVGTKKANTWGLHDMHGNVSEWCRDLYEDYPRRSATDPTGPTTGSIRVHRGGSWFDRAELCRSALRSGRSPGYRSSRLGFRPAAVPMGR